MPFGSVPKWSNGSGCRPDGSRLRGFKSLPAHQNIENGSLFAIRSGAPSPYVHVRLTRTIHCIAAHCTHFQHSGTTRAIMCRSSSMVEQSLCKRLVGGSSPLFGSKLLLIVTHMSQDNSIMMECTVCKHRRRNTHKNVKKLKERLMLSMYCKFCKKHTEFKESK